MKRVFLILCLVLPVLAFAQPAAGEEDPTRCGGSWQPDRAECSFVYQGGAVHVWLYLEGEPAGASVVRLEGPGPVPEVPDVILTCEAVGHRSACSAVAWESEPIVPLGTELSCIVEGRMGDGTYGCSSGD